MKYPNAQKCYVIALSPDLYRYKEISEIIGVKFVTPDHNLEMRMCYRIEFPDGEIDYIPCSDVDKSYKIVC
jgi:hypothetical protein